MTTINLYQSQGDKEKQVSSKIEGKGFFFSLGILIITLIILFGLKFYIPIVEGKSAALNAEIDAENSKLVGLKKLEKIVDIQKRAEEIRATLNIKNDQVGRIQMNQVLSKLGSSMINGVVVSNYDYSPEKISVVFDANNFNDASKQILSFKKSDYFTNVNLVSIARTEKAITCSIEMKIKQ